MGYFCENSLMSEKLTGWNDTIAALATPQGIGALALIRISGKDTIEIVNRIFRAKSLSAVPSHTLHVGLLEFEGETLDEVVISVFRAPRSYTGEDIIEISCHGSHYIVQKILEALYKSGARPARPGEFTQRAFLNGKLDLTQAEAVADLIASNTEASKNTALQHMRGGFSKMIRQIRETLLQFSALIELELDFSQEDVEFADRAKLFSLLQEASRSIVHLAGSFDSGNVIRNGVEVAIIGKPNAGKSTLLNTLLNDDRALVSDIPGTTRDTIEEIINIRGILFRLIDTAGIRDSGLDIIENMGVEKSLSKMRNADIVVYLFDAVQMDKQELAEVIESIRKISKRVLLVGNKSDLLINEKIYGSANYADEIVYISAKEHKNIEKLKDTLYEVVINEQALSEETIITNVRHVAAIKKIQETLNDIIQGLQNNIPADLIAIDIRHCLYFLGEITGEVTNEEQLDYIFSKFCIGK